MMTLPESGHSRRALLRAWLEWLRPSYDGPSAWLFLVGLARVALLVLVISGALFSPEQAGLTFLMALLYGGACVSSIWYLLDLRRVQFPNHILTWTQMLVDFSVVALTVSYTSQHNSVFTSLFVIVILEAGVLMGLVQGFLFACLASVFMLFLFSSASVPTQDVLAHYYNFLIQVIAFFLTAFISGYWNQRVSRMKQFQREILDNMNSGFLIVDTKGIVVAINRAGGGILNLKERDVIGRHVEGILAPEAGTECPVTTALRLKKDFASYEFVSMVHGMNPKLLGLTTSLMRDIRDRTTGVIATFTDLTEVARMRQELQQQERMAFVGELSAELAHEIRNPITSIRGAVDELSRTVPHSKLSQRLVHIALRESDHLNDIVSGFLDFARDPNSRLEKTDLRALMVDVQEALLHEYRDCPELEVAVDAPDTPCLVMADRTQLRQVFINLGHNAVEAMNGTGRLSMVLWVPADGRPGEGRTVEVCFEDEGPGIDPDKVARIFEPFYTEKEQGVGMGLAVCMRIITTHNGTLQVASRSGGGTAMIVRLPRVMPE